MIDIHEHNLYDCEEREPAGLEPADTLGKICQTLGGFLKKYDDLQTSGGCTCSQVVDLLPYITCLRYVYGCLAFESALYVRALPGLTQFVSLELQLHDLRKGLDGITLRPLVLKGDIDWEDRNLDKIPVESRKGISRLDDQLSKFQNHPVSIILRKCLALVIDKSALLCKNRPLTALLADGSQGTALRETIHHGRLLTNLCCLFSYLEFFFSYEDAAIIETVENIFWGAYDEFITSTS